MKIPGMVGMVWVAAAMVLGAQATRVRIEGLRHTSAADMLDRLGGRLEHVYTSPASPPLADDAAFLLRELLRKDGYADAVVDWRVAGSREVVLRVREGTRRELGEVTVRGVPAADAEKLARLYARPVEKDRPLGGGSPPFREELIEAGLANVRQELNANGYWAAEVSLAGRERNPATGAVDLVIDVRRGPAHRIAKPVVTGDDQSSAATVARVTQPQVGKQATTAHVNAVRKAVEESVITLGYPDAQIRMTQSLRDGWFVPEFSIVLGERVRLRQVRIEGLERTRPGVVMEHFDEMPGEWYDEALMNRRLRGLLASGAFGATRIETEPAGDGWIDAVLDFDEARAREVSLGVGVGSYQGLITRASYTDRNFLGRLLNFSSGVEIGTRSLLGEIRLTDPWWMGTDLSATARVYALSFRREGYDANETGIEGKITWRHGAHYSLDLQLGYALVDLNEDGLPAELLGEATYANPHLVITQRWDYRDNPVLPKNGWHVEVPLEFGAAIGDTTTGYFKGGISGGWIHQLNPRYQIGIGGHAAVMVPTDDGTDLPIDLRLFNGGSRSVRSFQERELGAMVNAYPVGGEGAWSTNVELIRHLGSVARAVVFFDMGSLAGNYEDIHASRLEMAAGLGLRLDLPVGPVRFEYGYNLTRDDGEPAGAFHFAIGHAY